MNRALYNFSVEHYIDYSGNVVRCNFQIMLTPHFPESLVYGKKYNYCV